jgi:hypothetical protein
MSNTKANNRLRKTHSTDLHLTNYTERSDFNVAMKKLYSERKFWIFMMGQDWFNRQAERYLQNWTESGYAWTPDNDYTVDRVVFEHGPDRQATWF